MFNRASFVVLCALAVLLSIVFSPTDHAARAGGWAVVTLDDLPEHIIAGEAVTVGFAVRQHGVTTPEGLEPRITIAPASSGGNFEIAASEDTPGHYTADLMLPNAGEWTWSINAFGPEQAMPALDVLPARTANEQIAYGAALFVAKGCAVCHQQDRAGFEAFASNNRGPELTAYTSNPDFLRAWLHDPSAVKSGTVMPTLGLSEAEIEALIAFLNAE